MTLSTVKAIQRVTKIRSSLWAPGTHPFYLISVAVHSFVLFHLHNQQLDCWVWLTLSILEVVGGHLAAVAFTELGFYSFQGILIGIPFSWLVGYFLYHSPTLWITYTMAVFLSMPGVEAVSRLGCMIDTCCYGHKLEDLNSWLQWVLQQTGCTIQYNHPHPLSVIDRIAPERKGCLLAYSQLFGCVWSALTQLLVVSLLFQGCQISLVLIVLGTVYGIGIFIQCSIRADKKLQGLWINPIWGPIAMISLVMFALSVPVDTVPFPTDWSFKTSWDKCWWGLLLAVSFGMGVEIYKYQLIIEHASIIKKEREV